MSEIEQQIPNSGVEKSMATPTGKPNNPRDIHITNYGPRRSPVPDEERWRVQALELAVQTFQSTQGLDVAHTERIIDRAKKFQEYITNG